MKNSKPFGAKANKTIKKIISHYKTNGLSTTIKRASDSIFNRIQYQLYTRHKLNALTQGIAKNAIEKIRNENKKGLFLDCGSNLGQGFLFFKSHFSYEFFDYELFEPNPNCHPHLEKIKSKLSNYNITIHQLALGTKSGPVTFYGIADNEGGELSQGGSVLKEHNSNKYQADDQNAITVEAFDFSSFLDRKLKLYSTIVIKMDIEGGEYAVLQDILDKNLFSSIHSIFCEFHSQYMMPEKAAYYRKQEIDLERQINNTGCQFVLWV